MKHVAILDELGIFRGRQEIADEDLKPEHIEVDDALEAGRYRWDGKTFVALAKEAQSAAPGVVPFDVAFYGLIEQLAAAGVDPGPVARMWARNFEKSIDAIHAEIFGIKKGGK